MKGNSMAPSGVKQVSEEPLSHGLGTALIAAAGPHRAIAAGRYSGHPHLTKPTEKFGGAGEARTPDLRIANATLSQLSYGPTGARGDGNWEIGTWLPAYKSRPPGLPPCNSPPPGLGRADNGNIARTCQARAWGDRPASCGRPASGVFRRESCIILGRRRSLFRRTTGRIS